MPVRQMTVGELELAGEVERADAAFPNVARADELDRGDCRLRIRDLRPGRCLDAGKAQKNLPLNFRFNFYKTRQKTSGYTFCAKTPHPRYRLRPTPLPHTAWLSSHASVVYYKVVIL